MRALARHAPPESTRPQTGRTPLDRTRAGLMNASRARFARLGKFLRARPLPILCVPASSHTAPLAPLLCSPALRSGPFTSCLAFQLTSHLHISSHLSRLPSRTCPHAPAFTPTLTSHLAPNPPPTPPSCSGVRRLPATVAAAAAAPLPGWHPPEHQRRHRRNRMQRVRYGHIPAERQFRRR